ncbi:alcohol dehydrogenase [Clohesyomyces aquaticus]|uniref:Alcohol dehydrogenase n=1 Tax=Clohesyomyces aquaticus TaxID=1231657 RepID=A0A1Y1Z0C0_9PLEO|nr:alcohol dehydrogenase [Clohesyomyces aquaticus]
MTTAQLPASMKAWVIEEFNTPYRLQELPLPTIDDPNDILIRVEACSYCHTDAIVAAGTITPPKLPFIGCHEFAGKVVALPAGQESCHGYKLGDRVAVSGRGNHVCGKCRECTNSTETLPDPPGYSVYCSLSGIGLGCDRPGGFREYAIVDARQVGQIPEGLSPVDVAPLMCAGLTMYAALVKCDLRPGARVGIMGCGGGLGHLGLQFATKMGFKTTGVDVSPRALQLSRELDTGADIVDATNVTAADARKKMGSEDGWSLPSEMGLDAVLILPDTQKAFDYGVELVRDGGRVVVLSFPLEGYRISSRDLVLRRVRFEGSLIGSNRAMNDMFDFCLKHHVRAKITKYPFAKLNGLVDDYNSGQPGKLVIDMELDG